MSTPAPLLDVRDVTFRYNGDPVLSSCSASIGRKERYVIMGTSGSGKSTLLRLVLGILEPDAGSIVFEDRDVTKLRGEQKNAIRQRMGMVFQSAALISSLSVADNLALPLPRLTEKTPAQLD